METLFLKLINLSISAGWLILAVMALRFVLKKAPRWTVCLLWGLVALRLVCPVTIESRLSLLPSAQTIPDNFLSSVPEIASGVAPIDAAVNPILSTSLAPTQFSSMNPAQGLVFALAWIWAIGAVLLLCYAAASCLWLRYRVRTATYSSPECREIRWCDRIDSPFVLGVIRPVVYLPYGLATEDIPHVLAHEQAHIRRGDPWWKLLGFLLLSVYWFQPLMWAAYVLLCRDIEAACDERVIRAMSRDQRRGYSAALLRCSIRRSAIAACPLAFGEDGVKNRVQRVMNYRKPGLWIALAAVIAAAGCAAAFLTNPISGSWIQLSNLDTSNGYQATYETHFTAPGIQGIITIEQWKDGRCIASAPALLMQQTQEIRISGQHSEETTSGIQIQVDTGDLDNSLQTWMDLSHTTFQGWSFSGYPMGRKEAASGSKYLAVFIVDEGTGVPAYESSAIEAKPELLAGLKNAVAVRATFGSAPAELLEAKQYLQLADVIELAKKGDALDWADFEAYVSEDISSGTYILRYPLEDNFSLQLQGPGTDEKPHNILLIAEGVVTKAINIRTNDVESFIQENRIPQHRDRKYYLTVGSEGVTDIRFSTPTSSGGCTHADGTAFALGEEVWLEALDGAENLDNLQIYAMDAEGTILWSISVPEATSGNLLSIGTPDGWKVETR